MPASETIAGSTVLFVFNGQDEALCRCCQTLGDAGVQVYYVPDVYSAMAQLAQGLAPSHVVVDVRLLDEVEMSFLTLGPQYFPDLSILVPLLDGTADRAANCVVPIDALPLEDLTDAVLGILPAVTATLPEDEDVVEWGGEEQADSTGPGAAQAAAIEAAEATAEAEPSSLDPETVETAVPPIPPLSTDIGSETTDAAPAMHEVVRQRMAGDQTARVPRTPPAAVPSWQAPCPTPMRQAPRPPSSTVSPEEIRALLDDGEVENIDDGLARPEHDTRSKG